MLEFYPQLTETSNCYEISNRALPGGSTMPLRQLNASNNGNSILSISENCDIHFDQLGTSYHLKIVLNKFGSLM